ncbi:MAG: hypothetical protein IPL03_05195 [Sterolibacteriaceae bacterium]|jgi:hypothetical protein|nr:hypothetical protein [Candidatus Methylophosphatis haderslevensis]
MQLNETVRASSCFHHSTRTLAPGESLPPFPSLFDQVVACRNGMLNKAANDESDTDDIVDECIEDDADEELDS